MPATPRGHRLLPLRSATLGGELVGMDNAVVIACAARRPAVTYAGSRE